MHDEHVKQQGDPPIRPTLARPARPAIRIHPDNVLVGQMLAGHPLVGSDRPVLYVITTGAESTADLPSFVESVLEQNWDTCVIATPEAARFFDTARVAEMTGHPVRTQFKDPDQPDVLPPADALLLAPATFNTINKLAAGISDTLALALLNEAIGQRLPVIAAPWVNEALGRHPAFVANVAKLRDWGMAVIGATVPITSFPWEEVRAELARVRAELTSGRPARPETSGVADTPQVAHQRKASR